MKPVAQREVSHGEDQREARSSRRGTEGRRGTESRPGRLSFSACLLLAEPRVRMTWERTTRAASSGLGREDGPCMARCSWSLRPRGSGFHLTDVPTSTGVLSVPRRRPWALYQLTISGHFLLLRPSTQTPVEGPVTPRCRTQRTLHGALLAGGGWCPRGGTFLPVEIPSWFGIQVPGHPASSRCFWAHILWPWGQPQGPPRVCFSGADAAQTLGTGAACSVSGCAPTHIPAA